MLEHYFSFPSTIDRVRCLWLGAPISRYAEWLSERVQSRASALYKIQTVILFDRFATDWHVRTLEELLRLVLPGFVGTERRQPWPLQDLAPGFLEHLRDERGLRPDTLHRYEHHFRVFERFLWSEEITDESHVSGAPSGANSAVPWNDDPSLLNWLTSL